MSSRCDTCDRCVSECVVRPRAKSYSTMFEQTAAEVWAAIRDFGDYQCAGTANQATSFDCAVEEYDRWTTH